MVGDKPVKLSVVIASFNAARTIGNQLEALARQEWNEPWEIIVTDNGSTDGTPVLVEQYKQCIPNLRLVDASARRGAAYARNAGVQAAWGDALAFCDADDEVAPGWIAAMGKALKEHDFVVSQIEDKKLNEPWISQLWNPSRTGPRNHLGFLPAAASWGIGTSRSLYERLGGFDECMLRLSDIDFSWRAQLAGAQLHFVPEAVVHYRYRPGTISTYRQAYRDGEFQVLLFKKYAAHGMAWQPWKIGLRRWLRLLRRLPGIRRRTSRAKWARDFGFMMGHIRGSLKYRVLAL